ncbi:QRFP-like peptide receptor isoform X2 [Venturia canescens]|uniref:QRFP-like peptide receptor isoform X2 n=1 Tax=Venturia canescens TaxID=32260 RepID=UPI001C9C4047|nr:QRFP-like peptide receptor isoform X2 [Venturia canescens]
MANATVISEIEQLVNYTDVKGNDTFQNTTDIDRVFAVLTKKMDLFYNDIGMPPNYRLVALYVPIVAISIIANVLVIIVVLKNQHMRSTTNYFVINLSVADLLVSTLCIPTAIKQAITLITDYNVAMCKIIFYLQGVAVAASVFTIMAMSIDRYRAIKNPIAFRHSFNRKKICGVLAAIWATALGIFAPQLIAVTLHRFDEDVVTLHLPGIEVPFVYRPPAVSICVENLTTFGPNAHYLGIAWFSTVFIIPVSIVLIACALMARILYARKPPYDPECFERNTSFQQGFRLIRERKRIANVLITLALLFALCWFPYNILRLLVDLRIIRATQWDDDLLSYCLFFGHANNMLNPVVFCIMTRTFRRSITELLCQGWHSITECRPCRNTCSSVSGAQTRTTLDRATLSTGDTSRGSTRARENAARSTLDKTNGSENRSRNWRCYHYHTFVGPLPETNPYRLKYHVASHISRFGMNDVALTSHQHSKNNTPANKIRGESLVDLATNR